MSDTPTLFADEQDLRDELRAMAPRPSAEFATELDARVAGRFGEPERPAPAARKRRRFSLPLLAGSLASAAVAAVVVVVILSGGSGGTDSLSSTMSGSAASTTAAEAAAPPAAAGSQPRRVERHAQLTVAVAAGRFDDAAAQVPQIAAAPNAIVDSSRVSTDSTGGHASYSLRVPVGRLNDTLAQLSKLGRVTARDETGYDITGAVVSTEDRLGDLRAQRDSVRRQLAAQTDPDKAAELSDRLNGLRREVARVRGEAIRLQQRTSYATVSLTLDERRAGDGSDSDHNKGGIAGALDDAGNILGGMAAVGIVALAVALPIALLVVLLWKGAAVLRRRRREAGLA
jgi:hypothetical protein